MGEMPALFSVGLVGPEKDVWYISTCFFCEVSNLQSLLEVT